MKIGFVTDEISSDAEKAISIGVEWGIRHFELRMIGDHRVPQVEPKTIDRLLALRDRYGLYYTALSPGLFKGTLADKERWQRELNEKLPATISLARKLSTDRIIVFGFQKQKDEPAENRRLWLDVFQQVARRAQEETIKIAVENEPGFWCDTGSNTADLLEEIGSPYLKANWDPANAVGTQERPYPEGYEAIKPFIINVHIKDTVRGALIECVPIGEGLVNWQGQLKALQHEQIVDVVTIETHCLPLAEKSLLNLKRVRAMLGFEEFNNLP